MKVNFPGQRRGCLPDLPNNRPDQERVFSVPEAGLVTEWYLARRCEEECYRARRYQRPLALLIVEPQPRPFPAAAPTSIGQWLIVGVRASDIAASLGNSQYAVLLPETDREQATKLASRLQASLPQVHAAVAGFPEDGQNLDELVATAREALRASASPGPIALTAWR